MTCRPREAPRSNMRCSVAHDNPHPLGVDRETLELAHPVQPVRGGPEAHLLRELPGICEQSRVGLLLRQDPARAIHEVGGKADEVLHESVLGGVKRRPQTELGDLQRQVRYPAYSESPGQRCRREPVATRHRVPRGGIGRDAFERLDEGLGNPNPPLNSPRLSGCPCLDSNEQLLDQRDA